MTKKFKEFAARSSGLVGVALPLIAFAQPGLPNSPINNIGDLLGGSGVLCTIFKWIFAVLILVAVVFILLAAFKYITAGGDVEKVKTANKQILFAAIAVIIALVARVIPNLALGLIGSSSTVSTC